MYERKYEFTDEAKVMDGQFTVRRIRALKTFKVRKSFANEQDDFNSEPTMITINKGDLGGWVQSEENLSQEGNAWVSENAVVYHGAKVKDNAHVYGNAIVHESATIEECALIYGNANIHNVSPIGDEAEVCGNADVRIDEYGCIGGKVKVYGMGKTLIVDSVELFESARIFTDENSVTIIGGARCDVMIAGEAQIINRGKKMMIGEGGLVVPGADSRIEIADYAKIFADCYFRGTILVRGCAEICGDVELNGYIDVCGTARMDGRVLVDGNHSFSRGLISNVVLSDDTEDTPRSHCLILVHQGKKITFYRTKEGKIQASLIEADIDVVTDDLNEVCSVEDLKKHFSPEQDEYLQKMLAFVEVCFAE